MKLSSYHLHTTFCDGKSTAEEMILAAIGEGCAEIGFSGHSYLPDENWAMSEDGTSEYFDTLTYLREKYKDKIKVYIGIEQDFYSAVPTLPFDYIIGSVHSVCSGGKSYSVDESAEATLRAINEGFGGDAYAYCEAYYESVSRIYEKTKCDIIGHFDLVTKFIEESPIFSESHPRYIAARDRALEALLKTPAVFEVNTGAISRGYRTTPYPSNEIIDKIAASGKPFVINSDAHSAKDITFMLEDVAKYLDKKGYQYIKSLTEVI
ncbi:MAG: histidinol-phosphatase HisJ family protein [Ruminococcaceae bacterium]|nr:histidinol-phosphatase HisJ family protein [Oscillospiraceae bacterium]